MSNHVTTVLPLLWIASTAVFGATDPGEWIIRLGGTVERGPKGSVIAVNLRGSWINDTEMAGLLAFPDLEKVDLSHTRITDEGLLRIRNAKKITDLSLFYSEWITDQGLTAIRDWKQLRRLNVRGTRISDATLELVSHLPGLQALDIAHTAVSDNGLDYLITLINLKELSLGRGRLNAASFEMLRMLPTLTYLDISGAKPEAPDMPNRVRSGDTMPEATLRAIAELKELRVLKLGYSSINADGLRILSTLSKVEKLGLEGCRRIDDKAVVELVNWKSLKYLDVQETQITDQGLQTLLKARPGLVALPASVSP